MTTIIIKTDEAMGYNRQQKIMRKMFGFCAVIALLLCSCSSIQTVSYSETRTVEPTQGIMHVVPLIADLQVSETRITYTENVTTDVTNLNPSQIDAIKSTVLFNAIKHYNADVMVAPVICAQSIGIQGLVVTITGFPATYKNIRNASKEDSWCIQVEPAPVVAPAPAKSKFNLFNR